MIFRDGSKGEARFDRLEWFDARSKQYPLLTSGTPVDPVTRFWECNKWLDQGRDGMCVGAGITHALIAEPFYSLGLDIKYAKERIYWAAQKIDPWKGGSYPEANIKYEGTAVLAGLKIIKAMGWIKEFRYAYGLHELQNGISYEGVAVLGLPMFTDMQFPNMDGFIYPKGRKTGGHCLICIGINVEEGYFLLHNSWGARWGQDGRCKITFKDMDYLLKNGGEAAFIFR